MTTLFLFRQDLRLDDNTGLIAAINDSKTVVPVFIFDTDVLDHFPKPDDRMLFLIDAVRNLQSQLQQQGSDLYIYVGKSTELVPQLMKEHHCDALYHNRSYGSGSQNRDKELQKSCLENGHIYKNFSDFLLVEPGDVEQRKVFTPFFKLWRKKLSEKQTNNGSNPPPQAVPLPYQGGNIDFQGKNGKSIFSPGQGGYGVAEGVGNRDHILQFLHTLGHLNSIYTDIHTISHPHRPIDGWKNRFLQYFGNYDMSRNYLWDDGTTKLSPYMRFGLVSIRQIYMHFCDMHNPGSEVIISELAWREFWHHIMHYFPDTTTTSFQEKRRGIKWENNKILFEARCEGKTGYPIIDAAMRQLKQEHRMHNRARMIVGSFLTKDLLIDWTRGEKHFANYLLDYDGCVNIGNRQRAASVGADPKPLRIFSPILQAQRFDPQGVYIKKYIPELADVPAERLHDPLKYKLPYLSPIIDHVIAQRRAREVYKGSSL